jgi:hypothetical protein
VVLCYKRLSPCFISSPRDEARRIAAKYRQAAFEQTLIMLK